MANDVYSRDEFIAHWAKLLNCQPEPYAIAVTLINVKRNYQTAMAIIFGLSWYNHAEYLKRLVSYFESVWDPATDVATVEWLAQFVDHYVTDKEKYPEDAK